MITGASPTVGRSGGRALGLQGERTTKPLKGARTRRSSRGFPGGYEVHLSGTRPGRGSRGCRAAIDRHIHGVLTWWDRGGRSGGVTNSDLANLFSHD